MNAKMLKCLCDISNDDDVNLEQFFSLFPKTKQNLQDVKLLNDLKYIAVLYAADDIDCICVNRKAHDYFK